MIKNDFDNILLLVFMVFLYIIIVIALIATLLSTHWIGVILWDRVMRFKLGKRYSELANSISLVAAILVIMYIFSDIFYGSSIFFQVVNGLWIVFSIVVPFIVLFVVDENW